MQATGRILDEKEEKSDFPCLAAVVRSGFFNMNPAVVYVEMVEAGEEGCRVQVSAAAKEGLIKQHTAEKAVRKTVAALRGALDARGG